MASFTFLSSNLSTREGMIILLMWEETGDAKQPQERKSVLEGNCTPRKQERNLHQNKSQVQLSIRMGWWGRVRIGLLTKNRVHASSPLCSETLAFAVSKVLWDGEGFVLF